MSLIQESAKIVSLRKNELEYVIQLRDGSVLGIYLEPAHRGGRINVVTLSLFERQILYNGGTGWTPEGVANLNLFREVSLGLHDVEVKELVERLLSISDRVEGTGIWVDIIGIGKASDAFLESSDIQDPYDQYDIRVGSYVLTLRKYCTGRWDAFYKVPGAESEIPFCSSATWMKDIMKAALEDSAEDANSCMAECHTALLTFWNMTW